MRNHGARLTRYGRRAMHARAHNAFAPAIRSRARRRQISPSSSSLVSSCCLPMGKKQNTRGVDFTLALPAGCRTAVACCVTSSGFSMAGEFATSHAKLQLQTKQVPVVSTHVTLGFRADRRWFFFFLCTRMLGNATTICVLFVTGEPLPLPVLVPFQCLSISV